MFWGSCRCIISTKVSHEVPMALCESVFVSRFRRDVQQIPEYLGRPRTSILLVLVHHKSSFTKASLPGVSGLGTNCHGSNLTVRWSILDACLTSMNQKSNLSQDPQVSLQKVCGKIES